MSIWKQIGCGIAPPDQRIKISNMRLFKIAVDIAADDSDCRRHLSYLLIDPVEKTLTSGNGASFISTPDALDFYGYLGTKKILIRPASRLPEDCTSAMISFKERLIFTKGPKSGCTNIPLELNESKYPDLTEVLAGINDQTKSIEDGINFNPKLLRRMQESSGSQAVSLFPHKTPKGILYSVKFHNLDAEYKAFLMPVRAE